MDELRKEEEEEESKEEKEVGVGIAKEEEEEKEEDKESKEEEEKESKEVKEVGVEVANERCLELYRLSPSKANLLLTYCACSPFLSLIAELLMLKDVVTLLTVLTKRHEGTLQELSFVPPGMGFLKRLLRMSALVIKPFRDSSQNQDCYDDSSDSTFYNTFDRAKVLHRRTCIVVCTATNEHDGSLTRRSLERLGTLVTHFPCEFPSSSAEYQDGDVSITLKALPKTKMHFEVEFSLTGDPLPFTLQLSCLKCNRHNMISVLCCQVCDQGSRLPNTKRSFLPNRMRISLATRNFLATRGPSRVRIVMGGRGGWQEVK